MFGFGVERHMRNLGYQVQEDPNALGYFVGPGFPLDKYEQADIVQAALLAHRGYEVAAERARQRAGYGNLAHRDDADGIL